jgi:ABC-type transport system involved in multi-copper enzyme maturation permease subunit
MRNIAVVFRREFVSYFNSPIAYIFLIVFLLLTIGLYMMPFFLNREADMRAYFGNLPLLLCFFIPGVSMRLWAEDKRLGTFEMLMTLPMRSSEVMLGKYFAALAFYCVALLCTLPLPVIVNLLGNPDNGMILGGYIGALLLGALYLSVGTFASGLMRDQISALILGVMACLAMNLFGYPFIAAFLDGWREGFGTFLQRVLGLTSHYQPMLDGLLSLGDLTFFVALSAGFLVLNALWLEGRKY